MKALFIILCVGILTALIGTLAYQHRSPTPPAPLPAPSAPVAHAPSSTPPPPLADRPEAPPSGTAATSAPLLKGAAALATIDKASTQYDASAVPVIVPYLYSPEKDLRAAALDGLLRLGEAAASPYLREAAKHAPSPQEADEWLKAADYLALPAWSAHQTKQQPSATTTTP